MFKFIYKKPKPSKSKYEYKMANDFDTRRRESTEILKKHPTRIPIIVEKSDLSNDVPEILTHKWVIESSATIGQLIYIIRNEIKLQPEKALYFFVNNRDVPGTQESLSCIYENYKNETKDGWLYITYSSENAFGFN
jgi:hypothetical protein